MFSVAAEMAVGVLVVEILGASTKGRALLQDWYQLPTSCYFFLFERVLLVQPMSRSEHPRGVPLLHTSFYQAGYLICMLFDSGYRRPEVGSSISNVCVCNDHVSNIDFKAFWCT